MTATADFVFFLFVFFFNEECGGVESGFSLVSLETKVILFCAVDASYPVQTHTCLKRFMKINPDHSGPPIKTMKPVTLFLTAVRIMNLNITILAASIHGSIVILCLATIIVSVKETLQAVSFATFIQIPLPVDAGDASH